MLWERPWQGRNLLVGDFFICFKKNCGHTWRIEKGTKKHCNVPAVSRDIHHLFIRLWNYRGHHFPSILQSMDLLVCKILPCRTISQKVHSRMLLLWVQQLPWLKIKLLTLLHLLLLPRVLPRFPINSCQPGSLLASAEESCATNRGAAARAWEKIEAECREKLEQNRGWTQTSDEIMMKSLGLRWAKSWRSWT